jgi:hypothetical protein
MRKRAFFFILLLACGSRTALLVDEPPFDASTDGSVDGGRDGSRDAVSEQGPDVEFPDVVPPIDVVTQDVLTPNDCADAAVTLVYLFSEAGNLLSFDPPTLKFKTIGKVNCPTQATPNSMAVDHTGVAYANLVGNTGEIWKINTGSAACTSTPYKPQNGFIRFGMGFTGDLDGGENLYISDTQTNPSGALAQVNVTNINLSLVGTYQPALPRCELSGTGDGKLYAFCVENVGSKLALIDQKTAKVIGSDNLKVGGQVAFAFAFWGGVFWMFTGNNGSTLTKYDPMTKSETTVMNITDTIVGAGVSTCAPVK